jgi:hypothetical protein
MLLVLFGFDPKQVVSFEELLMSQVVSQEVLTRLLVEKGVFTKDEFLEMVKAVDRERKLKKKEVPQVPQGRCSRGGLPYHRPRPARRYHQFYP